jgi:hypothetical protein
MLTSWVQIKVKFIKMPLEIMPDPELITKPDPELMTKPDPGLKKAFQIYSTVQQYVTHTGRTKH